MYKAEPKPRPVALQLLPTTPAIVSRLGLAHRMGLLLSSMRVMPSVVGMLRRTALAASSRRRQQDSRAPSNLCAAGHGVVVSGISTVSSASLQGAVPQRGMLSRTDVPTPSKYTGPPAQGYRAAAHVFRV